jgi:MoaA/NifB/PqqE/SkfB family radical SAM enzyme
MDNVYEESKLAFHPDKLKSFAEGKITAPICVRVKPTNHCNHHCFYCSYDEDNKRSTMNRTSSIPLEKMREILDDFKEIGVKAVTFSGGGEPLTYPHIEETMEKVLESGIDLSIITNGQLLKEKKAEILSKAKWVRISLDSSDAKTFAETRRVPESWFDDLMENIKNFSRIKDPSCEFGINFVVTNSNADKVYNSIKLFKELGVNHVKITPVWVPHFSEYHKQTKENVEEQIQQAITDFAGETFKIYETYKKDFTHSGVAHRGYGKCYHMQTVPVIAADSKVYFCHDKAYQPDGVLGSIENQSFKELWFSDKAAEIFRTFDPREGCQHHCANDKRNMGTQEMLDNPENIENYKPSSERHKNFI